MSIFRVPCLILCLALVAAAQPAKKGGKRNKGENAGRNNWNQSEYSGTRTAKDVSMAMYSKSFAWLSGSPADNEKLSRGSPRATRACSVMVSWPPRCSRNSSSPSSTTNWPSSVSCSKSWLHNENPNRSSSRRMRSHAAASRWPQSRA